MQSVLITDILKDIAPSTIKKNIGLVGHKIILFTTEELDKATNNFNVHRILGQGGQCMVYKGMLTNGRTVAIKKSKVFDLRHRDFMNEMVILSHYKKYTL